jgi:PAS domain S-box-containing protein
MARPALPAPVAPPVAARNARENALKCTVYSRKIMSTKSVHLAMGEQLDLLSIVRALQTISGSIVLDDLSSALLKIVLEHGSAQRAALLLAGSGPKLSLQAEAEATAEGVEVRRVEGGSWVGRLPYSIVYHVLGTRARVLLDDAAGEGRFAGDEYVRRAAPRSVLCLPIVRQAEVVGLLYLENNLRTGAFTPDRLSVLELVASQAAISLENARLYADLERENLERRAAERAVSESKGILQSIADNAPVVVFVKDLEGRYLLSNRQHRRVSPGHRGAVLGKTDLELFPKEMAERFRLSDREALEASEPVICQELGKQDDGLHTYISTKFPLRDEAGVPYAVGCVATDITETIRASEALRQSEERFRLLVDGLNDCALFMADAQGRVATWNAGTQRLFGHSEAEIVGQPAAGFFAAGDVSRGELARAFRKASDLGSFELDGWRVRQDGSRFFANVAITTLRDERGELRGYSVLVRDLSQRVKLEEQVRQAQKMEAVGRLAGGVAHDFNNLLAVIYAVVAHGLRSLDAASPVRGNFEQIQEAAGRAGELTKQLLAFARKQRVKPRVFDLNELALSTDKLVRRVLGDHIELVTLPSPDLGSVIADPGQIEQVILNLVVNARDAMPQGGTLTLETSNVELTEVDALSHPGVIPGPFAMLALSDTGTGIPDDVLEHIFEPFFTTKEPGVGTGLGLATSYGIINQAGGHLWVESEQGRGTTFKVFLPRAATEGASLQPATVVVRPSRGETILLVEDHAMLRSLTTQLLVSLGYKVLAAGSGDEALRLAVAHQERIDLLLTDVMMPNMGGHELAGRMVAAHPGLRVLFVSGYSESDAGRQGASDQLRSFLAKPFTLDDLAIRLRELLDGPGSS